jgi:alpha-mannosidase
MDTRTPGLVKRITRDIEGLIYADPVPISDIAKWETKQHRPAAEAAKGPFEPCSLGDEWGGPWETAWFRLRFTLPKELVGRNPVARICTGGEAVAFIKNAPVIGLNRHRDELPLPPKTRAGRSFEVLVEAGANDDFGRLQGLPKLVRAELAATNEEVRQLGYDLAFLRELAEDLPARDPRCAELWHLLNKAIRGFNFASDDVNREAAKARKRLAPLFERPANASSTALTMSGHAHIDVAWKWPLAETTRKCARTFSSVVEYMSRYPEFTFTQTQSYLYEVTKATYPKLYRRICDAVKAGQWEPATAMYVEADQNVPSGESLVRQLVFGKRFAREAFDVDVDALVLPDVFGYNAQLPQLLRKAGVPYFTTQKISWNDTNLFPFNSFIWEGLDGSTVLTHFLPGHNYNSHCTPRHLRETEGRHTEKGHSKPVLYQYGHGDGGGGPTPQMIEYVRRAGETEALPRCKAGFVSAFFRELEGQSADLPRWVGEFYLELHRGTYTTQCKTKWLNRRCELALRDAELLGAVDAASGGRFDAKSIEEAWRLVLLNQFHDVLPGSSIREVYEVTEPQLSDALFSATTAAQSSAEHLARGIDTSGDGTPIIVWNTLSWPRTGVVQVERPAGLRRPSVISPDGAPVPVQKLPGGDLLFLATDVPPMGYAVYRIVSGPAAMGWPLEVSKTRLENAFVHVKLNANGEVTSLIDKTEDREVLAGPGNELQLFDDRPMNWEAWDVEDVGDGDKRPVPRATSVEVVEDGPVRAAIEVRRTIGQSTWVQRIVLHGDSPCVEFETTVDWHEDRRMIKVAFPVAVRWPTAAFEIQFGYVERPTHRNTSWDAAKYEVCAHRWMDLSDATYGVSVLNDCKYGCDVRGNVMRLTLLRAPKEPDPQADLGEQTFRYAIVPHVGGHGDEAVTRWGYEFNVPLRRTVAEPTRGDGPVERSFFAVDEPAIVLDTVKPAEDGDGLILRLYEAHGGRARGRLTTSLPLVSSVETDLLEREAIGEAVPFENDGLDLELGPFEVRTLRVR